MTTSRAGSSPEPAFAASELGDNTTIWLVRHGETEWSVSGQHTGLTDIPLTDAGKKQALALREVLADVHPALVLCSPRSRAQQTAALSGLTIDETTDDLAEWDYGAYEGRTSAEIRDDVPDWTIWTHGVPGGETAARVRERADRVLARCVEATAEGPVVLVGHGHFSRVLGARWIGLPVAGGANLLLGTAAPSVLGAQYGVPVIDRWNLPNPAS
jgi:probable phosphoglycerate mutase